MIPVVISEATANLSKYIDEVQSGLVIEICDRYQPSARLTPLTDERAIGREFGHYRESVRLAEDFSERTPDLDQMFFGDSKVESPE